MARALCLSRCLRAQTVNGQQPQQNCVSHHRLYLIPSCATTLTVTEGWLRIPFASRRSAITASN